MAIPSRFELRAVEEGRMTEDELVGKYGRDNILQALDLYEEEDNAAFPGYQDRMAASFATTPEGEASIYRQRGYNVDVTPEGLMATTGYGTRRVDPQGFDLGDIADVTGQSIPTILGTLGALIPGFNVPGAVLGEMTGEGLRQGLGNLVGSNEGVNEAALAEAGVLGLGGEFGGRLLKNIGNIGLAPFKNALTTRLNRSVVQGSEQLDEALGTNLQGQLPLSAMTESKTLQGIEQRVAESPLTRESYETRIRNPFAAEQERAMGAIQGRVGEAPGREAAGEMVFGAAAETLEARRSQVDEAYDQLRSMIDLSEPLNPTESKSALRRMREMTGGDIRPRLVRRGRDGQRPRREPFELTAKTVNKLDQIERDLALVNNFGQLDNYRKAVGSLLKEGSDEFRRVGLDQHMSNLYGAMLRDTEKFFAEQGARRSALLEPQMVPEEEVGEAATRAVGMAREGFDLERASINRILKDPDAAGNLVPDIMSGRFQPKQVERIRQRFGALPGESGLVATEQGEAAWQAVQAEIIETLKQNSIKKGRELEGELSGDRMLSAIKQMGGPPKLNAIFGDELGGQIFSFAAFLRDADVAERTLTNPSRTAVSNEILSFMTDLFSYPARALGRLGAMKIAGEAVMRPSGRRFLTEGAAQDATSQNLLTTLGRLGARGSLRALGPRVEGQE